MMPVNDLALLREEIRQLKIRIAEQDEQLIFFKELLRPSGWHPPMELGLTISEGRLLACLYKSKNELRSREFLVESLYQGSPDTPELKIIDVFVCKIRKKLKDLGITIENVWGQGYKLPLASADIIDQWINLLPETEELTVV